MFCLHWCTGTRDKAIDTDDDHPRTQLSPYSVPALPVISAFNVNAAERASSSVKSVELSTGDTVEHIEEGTRVAVPKITFTHPSQVVLPLPGSAIQSTSENTENPNAEDAPSTSAATQAHGANNKHTEGDENATESRPETAAATILSPSVATSTTGENPVRLADPIAGQASSSSPANPSEDDGAGPVASSEEDVKPTREQLTQEDGVVESITFAESKDGLDVKPDFVEYTGSLRSTSPLIKKGEAAASSPESKYTEVDRDNDGAASETPSIEPIDAPAAKSVSVLDLTAVPDSPEDSASNADAHPDKSVSVYAGKGGHDGAGVVTVKAEASPKIETPSSNGIIGALQLEGLNQPPTVKIEKEEEKVEIVKAASIS